MKATGAQLAVRALENLGVLFTFGIPGVHNTELYDELNKSKTITPILVTHEGGASFMADAVSRSSSTTGTIAIVPAAGATHAASGIGEAFLDGIPMLVVSGGIRTDLDRHYQLHEIDQLAFMRALTKACFKIEKHADIVPTFYEAYTIAHSGEPGPVFIELPVNLQLFPGDAGELPPAPAKPVAAMPQADAIEKAARLLLDAKHPGIFVGWGAREAEASARGIAEFLQAPVATTLQGLSAFCGQHALHTGFGFGAAAVPAAQHAFAECDALLAVGTRFGEIATGSFGTQVPPALVHVDINPEVFDRNHAAAVRLEGDARLVLPALLAQLQKLASPRPSNQALQQQIKTDKAAYLAAWFAHDSDGRVNPGRFFAALRAALPDDVLTVVDDGNHTYLTAELFEVRAPGSLIVPTDFNAMGYAVPAAIGAKLANPEREVIAIVGDGAFLMTCMEILTATRLGLGVAYFVFHDGELSQIAQAQEIPYNRKPCTAIGALDLEGVAIATGAEYVPIKSDADLGAGIAAARKAAASGRPVVVDVEIDYSKRTAFTEGAVKTNFKRFPLTQRLRFVSRALKRRLTG